MSVAHEQSRTAAWCARLLLFAALIAGIVTMHTLGHPVSGHGSAHSSGGAVVGGVFGADARMPDGDADAHAPDADAHALGVHAVGARPPADPLQEARHQPHTTPVPAYGPHPAPAVSPGGTHTADGGTGMDSASVCLAVLSVWTIALLGTGHLLGRRAADLLAALRARLLRGLRPIPPPLPRHKFLAQLSVLRV
ncbi:hypothetical protein [Streptomyces sp. NPDC003077]|uniref:hypothetical protein n=1 Tax=Streptomyces sp. NPDC003077 TaxID=3154443 RepID=UPI0033BCD2A6